MSEDLDVADVLEAAAEVIEVKGWCQKESVDGEGRVCVLGAVQSADLLNRHPLTVRAMRALRNRLGLVQNYDVIAWNDRPGRTEGEVLDLLKHTAKDLRNEATV